MHGLAQRPRQALGDPPILPIAQGLPRGGIAPSAAQQDCHQWHRPRRDRIDLANLLRPTQSVSHPHLCCIPGQTDP